jgi:hypothetical protein
MKHNRKRLDALLPIVAQWSRERHIEFSIHTDEYGHWFASFSYPTNCEDRGLALSIGHSSHYPAWALMDAWDRAKETLQDAPAAA